MAVKTGKVISLLEKMAPLKLQADWDNCGLQAGNRQWPVEKILLALDVTLEVVQYAVNNNFNFIFSHHPLIFHKLSRVDLSTPTGQIIALALENHISIFAMHTNLDVVKGGVSDVLADLLNLGKVEVLDRQKGDYYKLAVFVPRTHLAHVRHAMGEAGAGWIGNYSHCTFSAAGTGTFMPREGTNPWVGSLNRLEEVEEFKLESLVEGFRLADVLAAMKNAHPYEEVAYDLIPVAVEAGYGLGRIGVLSDAVTLRTFADLVGKVLGCSALKLCGDDNRQIKRVAVCGGSGGNYVSLAQRRGADVLVTGDIDHHQALDAQQLGLAVIDPGHYYSELPILAATVSYLKSAVLQDMVIALYPGSTDPLRIQSINS